MQEPLRLESLHLPRSLDQKVTRPPLHRIEKGQGPTVSKIGFPLHQIGPWWVQCSAGRPARAHASPHPAAGSRAGAHTRSFRLPTQRSTVEKHPNMRITGRKIALSLQVHFLLLIIIYLLANNVRNKITIISNSGVASLLGQSHEDSSQLLGG